MKMKNNVRRGMMAAMLALALGATALATPPALAASKKTASSASSKRWTPNRLKDRLTTTMKSVEPKMRKIIERNNIDKDSLTRLILDLSLYVLDVETYGVVTVNLNSAYQRLGPSKPGELHGTDASGRSSMMRRRNDVLRWVGEGKAKGSDLLYYEAALQEKNGQASVLMEYTGGEREYIDILPTPTKGLYVSQVRQYDDGTYIVLRGYNGNGVFYCSVLALSADMVYELRGNDPYPYMPGDLPDSWSDFKLPYSIEARYSSSKGNITITYPDGSKDVLK